MRIRESRPRFLLWVVAAMVATSAMAFEPGTERVCTPAADGQSFECRERSGAASEDLVPPESGADTTSASDADPGHPDHEAPVGDAIPPKPPVAAASQLPSYLRQDTDPEPAYPETAAPATAAAASPASELAETATPSATEADDSTRATTDASRPANGPRSTPAVTAAEGADPAPAAVAGTAATTDAPTPEIRDTPAPADAAVEPAAASAPAKEAQAAAAPANPDNEATAASGNADPVAETPAVPSPAPAGQPGAARPREPLAAQEFEALPGGHYTLVLASVRDPASLASLILAMDSRPGPLYLLKLGMPDGDWYSLCWSDFGDLDSARAARASLPDEAAIRSGWPRRIGLLQREIAR